MVTVNGGFQKHSYPSIRHVILARRAHPLLLFCPNVKLVQCISHTELSFTYTAAKSPCIESAGFFRLTEPKGDSKPHSPFTGSVGILTNLDSEIAKALPNVHKLDTQAYPTRT